MSILTACGGGSTSELNETTPQDGSVVLSAGETASTTSSSLSGTLEIDADTGALTGSNLALVSPDGTDTATFIGTFNGVGASGVSALYYDNNDLPTVNGAIVGSR